MKNLMILLAGFCIVMAPSTATAQERAIELGQREYMVACAGCHGETGMGDGPIAGYLDIETPNLTKLASENDGEFPFEYAVWMIDGRKMIRLHGSPEMPIWGDRFVADVRREDSSWVSPEAAELVALGRIQALVRYLESIQE